LFEHRGVRLRKIEEADLEALLALKQESWPYTHRTTIANMADQRRWFEGLATDVHAPANLVLIAGSEEISDFGIFKFFGVDYVNRSAAVGWDIFPAHRGRRLGLRLVAAGAAFAFEIFNLNRLAAEILEDNQRSLNCARAVGFVEEGRARQAVWKRDRHVDSLLFGLLRSDFRTNAQKSSVDQSFERD
jgi:RimJ/RimL family protein N-acetyltransferase